jgi:septal ring factor EnvC (AmiA/AmiB activator)
MENRPVIEQLAEKIDALLARMKSLEEENARLRNELVAVKAQNEAKDAQIAKLNDELAMKDLEIEEVIGKIEAILGE